MKKALYKRGSDLMHKNLKKLVIMACVLSLNFTPLISFHAYAQDSASVEKSNDRNPSLDIQRAIISQNYKTKEKVEKLEALISSQKAEIRNLEFQIQSMADKSSNSGMTFETWSGILLGCVGVMVTVLSVMLAFFQMSGIRNAIREARDVANDITPKVAETKLEEHIKNGGFNKIIESAIDKIAFSNIVDPESHIEGENNDTE